jgi:hypothetical protein
MHPRQCIPVARCAVSWVVLREWLHGWDGCLGAKAWAVRLQGYVVFRLHPLPIYCYTLSPWKVKQGNPRLSTLNIRVWTG